MTGSNVLSFEVINDCNSNVFNYFSAYWLFSKNMSVILCQPVLVVFNCLLVTQSHSGLVPFFLVKIIELVILLSLDFICYQIDIEFWMLLMFVVAI